MSNIAPDTGRSSTGQRRVVAVRTPHASNTRQSRLTIGHANPATINGSESRSHHTASRPVGGAVPASPTAPTKKAELYGAKRTAPGSPRSASTLPAAEPVSRPPPNVLVNSRSADTRRQGVPVFAEQIRAILRDVMERKDREEAEEQRLRELLGGRVVGGADKFERLKVLPVVGDRVDASPGWMTTLF
ncbi:hypothetical protein B0H10DRAFT_1955199 [Mycena sp. CBHHK59/15]|nr:hypothetical protein B0H10DRAFT_1955199 [Mycena sp. CBHHK59/15]